MHAVNVTLSYATRRISVLLFIALLAEAGANAQLLARDAPLPSNTSVVIRKLTILSSDLPGAKRKQITTTYQGRGYRPQELAERVRQTLRDTGYYQAIVEDPLLTGIGNIDLAWTADAELRISAGAQYRLSEIRFTNVSAFTPALLREQFLVESGDLFNATTIRDRKSVV